MSNTKRYIEDIKDYKKIWKLLKKQLEHWHKDTDEDKQANESQLYKDMLDYMELLELEQDIEKRK